MTGAGFDRDCMARALTLARRGWGQVAPNPMVGAVVAREGRIVGEGWHARLGAEHAEPMALRDAGEQARGATVFVTLEPCAHHGRTPPCADALIAAGVARVVVGTRDPNAVAAGGADRLRAAGIAVEVGLCEAEARELVAPFLFAQRATRPWVTLKMAVSLDAMIADRSHTTSAVTGAAARAWAHALRAGHDAVAVGMGTVRIDDPMLTVRLAPPPRVPTGRVVFSRTGRLPLTSRLVASVDEAPVIVLANAPDPAHEALRARGVEVAVAGTLEQMLEDLRMRGVHSLLVEGGTSLAGALWVANLVDRLVLIQAPVVFGAGGLGAFAAVPPTRAGDATRWPVVERVALDDDLATTFALREP